MSRRTFSVVVLDSMLSLATRLQAVPMPQPKVRDSTAARSRWWRLLMVTGVIAALGGTALVVTVLVRTPGGSILRPEAAAGLPGPPSPPPGTDAAESPPPTATRPAPEVLPSLPSITPSSSAPVAPPVAGGSSAPPTAGAPPLTAGYRSSSLLAGLLGYHVEATVTNPGPRPRDGWKLVITLPRPTLAVSGVSGATATQDGAVWTFTPDRTTSRVAASDSVKISFNVNGATLLNAAPTDCQIDDTPCTT